MMMRNNNFGKFASSALAVAEGEARKIRHDSSELWMRCIQPALWLVVYGEVMNSIRGLAPGGIPYIDYIAPGVLAQSVLFIAILYGVQLVWERDFGILTKLLSTPSPRSSIVVGKALASGIRGLCMALIVFGLAVILRLNLRFDPLDVAGVFAVIVLFAMSFSSLSMILASILKTRDRMMGIGTAITMPLFFASSAIYPISLMPIWLQYIGLINPLTYVVDALRVMLLGGSYTHLGWDVLAVGVFAISTVSIASVAIKRLIQ